MAPAQSLLTAGYQQDAPTLRLSMKSGQDGLRGQERLSGYTAVGDAGPSRHMERLRGRLPGPWLAFTVRRKLCGTHHFEILVRYVPVALDTAACI